eukprot:g8609.t1
MEESGAPAAASPSPPPAAEQPDGTPAAEPPTIKAEDNENATKEDDIDIDALLAAVEQKQTQRSQSPPTIVARGIYAIRSDRCKLLGHAESLTRKSNRCDDDAGRVLREIRRIENVKDDRRARLTRKCKQQIEEDKKLAIKEHKLGMPPRPAGYETESDAENMKVVFARERLNVAALQMELETDLWKTEMAFEKEKKMLMEKAGRLEKEAVRIELRGRLHSEVAKVYAWQAKNKETQWEKFLKKYEEGRPITSSSARSSWQYI